MNEMDRKIYQDFKLFPIFNASLTKTPAVKKGTSWKDENNHITSIDDMTKFTYGLICGEKSNIMVLDIDTKEQQADILMKTLIDTVGLNERDQQTMADTLTIKTPNEGFHLYFKYKPGLTNINGQIMKDVDFKTEGGYVISPNSVVKDRNNQVKPYSHVRGTEIKPMPSKLFEFIKNKDKHKNSPGTPKKWVINTEEDNDPFATLKGMKAGDGRNSALNSALYKYCKQKNIKDEITIMAITDKINNEYFDEPEEGAYKTAQSVYKALNEDTIQAYYLYEYGGQVKVNTSLLAKFISENSNYLIVRKQGFDQDFIYWYEDGYYKRISINDLKGKIKNYIPVAIRKASQHDEVYKQLVTDKNSTRVEDLDADSNYINFKNGLYNVKTKKLEPHRSDLLSTIQINTSYVQGTLAPRWEKFLNFLTGGDNDLKKILQEWAGLTISNIPGYYPKKAMALYGSNGNNGKSVYINVLDYLIGTENVATRDIQDLSKPFATSDLYGKKALLIDDQKESNLADSSIFKSITGGGLVACEFKGKQSFSYRFNGTVTFGTNALPFLAGEKGSHIFERLLIIPCKNVLTEKERDPNMLENLKSEMEGILQWALEGLHRLIDNNFKLTESKSSNFERDEYRAKSDTLYRFVIENYEITGERSDQVLKTDFEGDYSLWAIRNEVMEISKNNIKDRAEKIGIGLIKNGIWYYKGIRPLSEDEKDDPFKDERPRDQWWKTFN